MTDGITESFDSLSIALASVIAGLASQRPRPASHMCDAIMARAIEGSGPSGVKDWTDDRTVVVITV